MKARKLQIKSFGFSSHAPLPFSCAWCIKPDRFDDYLLNIDRLRNDNSDLEIYTGLEVDFIPGIISPKTFSRTIDYSIGSIHFVESFPDGRRWEIDGLHSFFLEGLEKIFNNDAQSAIRRYYELFREMLMVAPPDIVGHLDKIKIQNLDEKFFREDDDWYRLEISKTLEVIEQTGVIVEVNTRGIYQKKSVTTYPGPWILEQMRKRNIPITLSSDAHHPDDLINQFPETAKVLYDLGFRKLMTLTDGKWKGYPFDENGITLP